MALVNMNDVDIKESGPDFEKFDVEKNDKALIHIPQNKVVQEFVHVFHREEPMMIERNGRKVPNWSRESFAGSFICHGDFETVLANPTFGDPTNCPACRAMNKEPKLVERPKRTFAMNVVRYATNKRSYDLRNNNVDVQIWRHADIRKLEPILEAARERELNTMDFKIEADNSDWKKYMIQPSLADKPAFTTKDELKANMKDAYDSLHSAEDLTNACGRRLASEALEAEITRLVSEWRLEASEDGEDGDGLFASSSDSSAVVEDKTSEGDLQAVPVDDLDKLSSSLFDE